MTETCLTVKSENKNCQRVSRVQIPNLLGKFIISRDLYLNYDQTKANGKGRGQGQGQGQRSATTGKYILSTISISYYNFIFYRKNITASELMRTHFPITLFSILLHLTPSTGRLTIRPLLVPEKSPNMQI